MKEKIGGPPDKNNAGGGASRVGQKYQRKAAKRGGITGKNIEKIAHKEQRQVCFQHNINFPFIKRPMHRPPVLTALLAPCRGPWGEGPLGFRSPRLSTLPSSQDNTLDSYTMLPLNLSAAPTRCSTGMHRCRIDQSGQQAVCVRKCVQECVCMSNTRKSNLIKKGSMHKFTTLHYTCTPMPVFSFVASHSITYTIQLQSYLCKAGIMLDCGHKHSFYTLLVSPKHTCTLSVLQCTACATTLAMTSCLGHLKIVLLFLYFV